MDDSDVAYGISPQVPQGGGKTVTVFFSNGTTKDFVGCTEIQEPPEVPERQVLIFMHGGRKFTFKKSQLAGWAY